MKITENRNRLSITNSVLNEPHTSDSLPKEKEDSNSKSRDLSALNFTDICVLTRDHFYVIEGGYLHCRKCNRTFRLPDHFLRLLAAHLMLDHGANTN